MPQATIERIILVGLSGAGKSSVAHALGPHLGWQVADTDDWIVAHTGQPIAALFEQQGETAFRDLEHQALLALCARPWLVLATGGGLITTPRNWPIMRRASRIVWLRASEAAIVERLTHQQQRNPGPVRPLLAGDLATRIHHLATARDPLYAEADITIVTDGLSVDTVVDQILATIAAGGTALDMPKDEPR